MSAERDHFDARTVTAAAVVAWSSAIAFHQVGHALVANAFGVPLEAVTALGVTGRWGALRMAGTLLTSVSGTAANVLLMACAWFVMRSSDGPGLRGVLGWLLFVSSGWIVAGHLVLSPVLGAGDWMTVVDLFANRGPLRVSAFVTGVFVCGVLWKATHERLAYVVGGGLSATRVEVARRLTRAAWATAAALAAGVGVVTGGWGPSDAMLQHNGVVLPESAPAAVVAGCLAALIGYALVALPIVLAPRMVEERPVPGPPLSLPRSPALIVAAFVTLTLVVGILGPGLRVGPV